jgi:uncharacterized protein YjcR
MADAIPGYSRNQLLADLEPLVKAGKFYSCEELTERYGVTIQTLKNWAKDKKLVPDLKVGAGCVRYSAALLAEVEKKHRGKEE